MSKTIYDLELHESLMLTAYVTIIRVPGGWIYVTNSKITEVLHGHELTKHYQVNSTFVPFNNEFKIIDQF